MDFTKEQINTIRQIVKDEVNFVRFTGPESVRVRDAAALHESLREADEALKRGEGIPGHVVFAELEARQASSGVTLSDPP